jgi:hypothetical protein
MSTLALVTMLSAWSVIGLLCIRYILLAMRTPLNDDENNMVTLNVMCTQPHLHFTTIKRN